MPRSLDAKQIKSAKRVFEVLEYFNADRQRGTVMDIAREYGYPQSSTSELLGCLVELGFLSRDRFKRTYRPTAKVAVLGAWTHPRLFRHGKLLGMMDMLAEATGCTVVLAGTVGVDYQYFHTVATVAHDQPQERASILTQGAVGHLLLSVHDRMHIRKVVHRLNSEVAEPQRVNCENLLVEVDTIRNQGYASTPGIEDGAGGMIAIRLPQQAADEVLAMAISVAPDDNRGLHYHLRALRNAVATSLGPVLAHEQPMDAPLRAAAN